MSAISWGERPAVRLVSFTPKSRTQGRKQNQRRVPEVLSCSRAFSAAKYEDRRDETSCTEGEGIDIHHADRLKTDRSSNTAYKKDICEQKELEYNSEESRKRRVRIFRKIQPWNYRQRRLRKGKIRR